jgi:hypothetical protein
MPQRRMCRSIIPTRRQKKMKRKLHSHPRAEESVANLPLFDWAEQWRVEAERFEATVSNRSEPTMDGLTVRDDEFVDGPTGDTVDKSDSLGRTARAAHRTPRAR